MNEEVDDVLIRPITENDVDDAENFLQFINGIICENSTKTSFSRKRSIKEEVNWLQKVIALYKEKKMLQMVASKYGRIVGMCDITLLEERKSHVGDFGIAIASDLRGKKLGQRLAEITIRDGAQFFEGRLKILRVCFPASKTRVRRFYELLGFETVAVVPEQYSFETLEPEMIMLRHIAKENQS